MALALVLILTVVLFLLGISITGLVTMESRSSSKSIRPMPSKKRPQGGEMNTR